MTQILKRLEIIKSSIAIEEDEIIELQILKLQKIDIDDEVKEILVKLENINYSEAIKDIENYLSKYSGVVEYVDSEIQGLKLELKSLESSLQKLTEQKTEYLNDIDEFNIQYSLHLGELIKKILELKKEILYKQTIKQQKEKERYQQDIQTFQETKETISELKNTIYQLEDALEDIDEDNEEYDELLKVYEELKEEVESLEDQLNHQEEELEKTKEFIEDEDIQDEYEEVKSHYEEYENEYNNIQKEQDSKVQINVEEKKELKKLFRKAAKLCHPDIVIDRLKEKAHELMKKLNEAYSKQDLQQVKAILHTLESGEGFEVSSEAIEDKELLKQKISEYKDSIKGIKSELEEIKEDDMYQTISSLDDWDVYFEELKSGLKAEKDRLADEARVVLEEKDSVTKTEPQIIENEDLDWMEKLWKWADEHAISKKILPRNSHDLKKLRSLSISGVDGGVNPPILLPISLPKEIGYLTDLQELEFTFCGLTELPKEIGNLKNLVDLELAWNNITKLPKEIGNLKNLKRLSVGSVISDEDWDNSPYGLNYDNCLTELPNEIYTLLNLEKLIIGHFPGGDYEGFGNRITKISKDIFNLKKLKSFELSYNNINNLTEVLPYFPNTLTSLGLTQMNLRNLPIEIGNLINLTALYLGDDYLTSIPEEICSLINLSDFWFSSNKNLILSKRQKEWINNLKIRSERQNGYILVDDNLINKVDIDTNFKKNELYNDAKFDSKANTIVAQIEDSPYANHIQNIENIKFEKIRKYCENLSKANEADEMQKQLGEKGKMYKALIYSSLEVFIEKLVGETITLCDWGCDQGIASMLVVDYIKEKQLDITVSDVLLIDDDTKVLSRAMAQVEALAQDDIKILTIKSDNNTIFDKIKSNKNNTILHLFANDNMPIDYLDIDYDIFDKDFVLCVSNENRELVNEVYENFKDFVDVQDLSIKDGKIGKFEKFERVFSVSK